MKPRRSMSFVWLLLIALIVPILAACGAPTGGANTASTGAPAGATAAGQAAPTTAAGTAATAAPTAAAGTAATTAATTAPATSGGGAKGGALRILYWQAPTILNPHQAGGTKDYDAAEVILEPLAAWSPDGKPVAKLAADIPTVDNGGVTKDFKSITWKLKPGLKWSDGTPFTADDVVFTWQYCTNKATNCTNISNFEPIDKVEAVDPNTVRITWKQPNPNYYIAYVGFGGMVIQKKQFAGCMGAQAANCPANNSPVGTGPYKLKDFKPGDVVIYEKNPNYRDVAKVGFDTVELKGGGDAAGAARAVFQTGETDFAWNLQVESAVLQEIMKGGKGDLINLLGADVERLVVNFANPDPALGDKRSEPDQKHPILSDLKVRQALSLAIDRKTMATQLYGITGVATCNILAAPAERVSKNTKCDQDVAKAKQLLDQAGWTAGSGGMRTKAGKPLVLTYVTTINPLRQKEQALVKANWKAIGVEAQLKAIDGGVFFSTDPGNPDTYSHFYNDIQMYTNSPDNPDPTTYFDGFTCANVAAKANQWKLPNNGRYCNKEYDALVGQLKKETDPAKRNQLAIKCNDMLVNDGAVIPLINRTSTPSGKAKDLQGPTGNPWDSNLWNIADWHK